MEDLSNPTVQNPPQGNGKPAGQTLGIAALITAIITFVMAVIPCVGIIAIIPGIIAIVLAGVGLSHAARENAPRGLLVAGLIIGIIASLIAFSQIFVVGKLADKADKWPKEFHNIINDVQDEVTKDLEDANISIKIENGNGDKVEITTNVDKKDREETLEELEKGNEPAKDSLDQKK
jgi:predicted PurR-regulated permease PerM